MSYGDPETVHRNDSAYLLQHYQGDHKDEYTLTKDGRAYLYQNGVLKMAFEVDSNGVQIGDFTRYSNGCAAFIQSFDDILNKNDFNRIVNHEKGERMEIYSYSSGNRVYHGEFNKYREREGWGIEYDEESGAMLLEGKWKNNKLIQIIRKIEGSIMTEFRLNGNNMISSKRVPLYVGEFVYDESKESFIRNGRGYLINEETRTAYREGEWKDGEEVSGKDLFDGWYTPSPTPKPKSVSSFEEEEPKDVPASSPVKVTIAGSAELKFLSSLVTDLTISLNSCNDLNELDLNRFEQMQSIEIGDNCFNSVKKFEISSLKFLKSLKIGSNSFTVLKQLNGVPEKDDSSNKSFRIVSCPNLESIIIGEQSFVEFSGDFELRDLPSLNNIEIGSLENESNNFYYSSFAVQSMGSLTLRTIL